MPRNWTVVQNGKLNLDRAAMHLYQAIAATFLLFQPQAPQAHSTRLLCKRTVESVSRYKRPGWDFVREIKCWGLRTLNIIILTYFFYKINKRDIPLVYSYGFWCEFVDLVGFFGCYYSTPVTFFITAKKTD